jgi:glycosyltransferase involved in cell wall biosynthesis
MRLVAVSADIHNVIADIRLVTPLQALCAQQRWSLQLRSFQDCLRSDLQAADVLVVQRAITARAWRLQQYMRRRGGAVIYDIDDLLTEIAPHISNHAGLQARQPQLRRCLAQSDLVSVSTPRLAQLLADTVSLPATHVVPNYALGLPAQPMPQQTPGPVTLLFASTEHMDVGFIFEALRALQGDGIHIVVVGRPGGAFEAAGLRIRHEALMPRADFLALARSLPNPVAVIPLEDSRFASGKSAIKWFDYADLGIPTLASCHSPYRDVIEHGQTGWLVPNDAGAWLHALQTAAAQPQERLRLASAARQVVQTQHRLADTVTAWQHAVEQALHRRELAALPTPSWRERLENMLESRLDSSLVKLRAINRARLARRQQVRQR